MNVLVRKLGLLRSLLDGRVNVDSPMMSARMDEVESVNLVQECCGLEELGRSVK